MGICADQFGAKSTLYGGLLCYIAGITFLLTLPNPWSYHLYYLLTSIGFPCMSGADMSLIRQHWGAEDGTFKSHVFALQKWSYLIIASLYLFTPLIYGYSKKLPFLLQICLLAFSILNLRGMRAHKSKAHPQRENLFGDFALAVRLCIFNRKYFLLLVCSSVFGLGISINHKVIQKQLMVTLAGVSSHQTMKIFRTDLRCSESLLGTWHDGTCCRSSWSWALPPNFDPAQHVDRGIFGYERTEIQRYNFGIFVDQFVQGGISTPAQCRAHKSDALSTADSSNYLVYLVCLSSFFNFDAIGFLTRLQGPGQRELFLRLLGPHFRFASFCLC